MISYGICLENISERTSAIENLCSTQSFGPFPTSLTIFVLVYLTCWLIILLPGLLNLFPTLEFPLPELANGFRVRESVMGLRCWCPIMVHMPRHHRHLRRRGIIPIYALQLPHSVWIILYSHIEEVLSCIRFNLLKITQDMTAEPPQALTMATKSSRNAGKYLKQLPPGCSITQHPCIAVVSMQSNIVLRSVVVDSYKHPSHKET